MGAGLKISRSAASSGAAGEIIFTEYERTASNGQIPMTLDTDNYNYVADAVATYGSGNRGYHTNHSIQIVNGIFTEKKYYCASSDEKYLAYFTYNSSTKTLYIYYGYSSTHPSYYRIWAIPK